MAFFPFKKLSALFTVSSIILTSFSSVTSAQTANDQNSNRSYIPNELIIRVKDGTISTSSNTDFKKASLQNSSWLANLGVINTTPLFKSYKKRFQKLQQINKAARLERYLKVQVGAGENIESLIARFKNDPNIEYVEPNYIYHKLTTTNDPKIDDLWAFNNTGQTGGNVDSDIDLFEAWDIETGSTSTIVAVIDTGVDYTHEDLVENIWVNEGEIPDNGIDDDNNGYVDDYRGWDFAGDDNDPIDGDTHGTHVSGTIGGVANNGIGVAGVAWNVRIMPLRFLDEDGAGDAFDAADAIKYAVDNGAKIINASWGGEDASEAIKEAIEYAAANDVLFVAAAGNGVLTWEGFEQKYIGIDNDLNSQAIYPSSLDLPNILAVAATDSNDELTQFSNYGLTTVDVAAPGYHILSSVPGDEYESYSGTSMATPITVGLAALIYSQDPSLSAVEIKQRIMDTVDSVDALQGKVVTGGRINAFTALNTNKKPTIIAIATVNNYDVTVSGNITDLDGFITSALIEISGVNTDYAQTVEINLDGFGDFSQQITDLSDDVYTINITATDDKDVKSITTETVMVGEVPNTIPTISVSEAISAKPGCIKISGSANAPDSYGSISIVTVKILGIGNINAPIDNSDNWSAEVCDLLNGQYIMSATATDNFGAKSLQSLEHIVEIASANATTDTLPNHADAGRVQKYPYNYLVGEFFVTTEYKYLRDKYCTAEGSLSYDCDGEDHEFTLYQCAGETAWTDDASACGSTTTDTDLAITSSENQLSLQIEEESEYTLTIANNGNDTTSAVYIESSELQIDCDAIDCVSEEGEIQILNITPSQGTCEIANDSEFNCSLGNMDQATTATIRVQIAADKAGNMNTNLGVSSAQTDTDNADNNTSVIIQIKDTSEEELDTDGDGVLDKDDAFPFDENESVDSDEDGTGDNADLDDDNDGTPDDQDAFPLDPSESADFDEDGTGDNADLDDDNDGAADTNDAFPQDPSEQIDTDVDGTGNNSDSDDDNDGTPDTQDAFPLDPSEQIDTDGDGTGDNADLDDDNDGTPDTQDAFPLDPSEQVDTDGDGIGDNQDTDDDQAEEEDNSDDDEDDQSGDTQEQSDDSEGGSDGGNTQEQTGDDQDEGTDGSGGGGSTGLVLFALLGLGLLTRKRK